MLFDAKTEVIAANAEVEPVTLRFDWSEQAYQMEAGSPVTVSGDEGAKTWLEQCLRTRRGSCPIYPEDYGCSALDILGKKISHSVELATLEAELQEAIRYCDEIASIGNLQYADGVITMDCVLTNGGSEVVTVG